MSPELIKGGTEGHDFSVDWWSVGVLTYELLTGASPFTVDGERNTQAEISKRILRNQPPIPEHLSGHARDFIRRLLVKEPEKRLGGGQADANQLKEHPFLASINWNLLAQRKLKAPFKPKIKHELDVSNFAEEFTSMAPYALVSSSNNQINDNNAQTTTSSLDDDHGQEDDYYESDESEQDESETYANDADDEFSDNGMQQVANTQDESRNGILNNQNYHHHLFSNNPKPAEFKLRAQNDIANNLNRQQQNRNQYQKESSLTSFGNESVIQKHFETSADRRQQVFSMMNPPKHQLSFSSLAKQHQKSLGGTHIKSLEDISGDFYSNRIDQLHQLKPNTINETNITRHDPSGQLYYNGVHFSKLFKGYSYMNPKAVEWLRQQERKCISRVRYMVETGARECRAKASSFKQDGGRRTLHKNVDLLKSVTDQLIRGVKAIPNESASFYLTDNHPLETADERLNRSQSKVSPEESLRVAFTIGDGEDLALAIRSAGNTNRLTPERLVVAKRKPSLELLYERHANHQVLTTSSQQQRHQPKNTIKLPNNPTADATLMNYPTKPVLGSIIFNPKCDFFKVYHLVNSLNSKRDLLGEGAYSVCKRCVHKETGKEYAVKLISRRCQETSREVEMLRKCQGHPNIVRLYDVFQDEYNSYLVFELLKGGELLSRIRGSGKRSANGGNQLMDERQVCRLFRSLVSTVDYLHSQRIVHRDLKPENLLFIDSSITSEMKLIDFGFARELPEINSGNFMSSPCVTLDYCAPEVLSQVIKHTSQLAPPVGSADEQRIKLASAAGYTESCDLWSMGVILYAMLSGRLPFKNVTNGSAQPNSQFSFESIQQRSQKPISFDGPEWSSISKAVKDVIRGLLNPNPAKRLTIQQLVHNDWLMNFDSLPVPAVVPSKTPKKRSATCKNQQAPALPTITMTLRKRNLVKSDETSVQLTTGDRHNNLNAIAQKPMTHKRSLDNCKTNATYKRPKLSQDKLLAASCRDRDPSTTSTTTGKEQQLDSKWLSRFVEIGRTNKDNLRITFRALNSHQALLVASDSRNGSSLDSQRQSGNSYELVDPLSPSASPSSGEYTIISGNTSSAVHNVSIASNKRQVKRLKLHYHDRSSAGSTGTTICTKSTDSYA